MKSIQTMGMTLGQWIGRGVGQVMFQNNAVAGWLMLLGIALNAWQLALAALMGNVTGSLSARIAGLDRDAIRKGLYGFNGTLVGLAVGVLFLPSWMSLLLLFVGSALSVALVRLFSRWGKLPGYTAPFILATWLLYGIVVLCCPQYLQTATTVAGSESYGFVDAVLCGIGQVMFQTHPWTGLVFFLALWLSSWRAAVFALIGSLLPLPVVMALGVEASAVNLGLLGYNAVLCAMALDDGCSSCWKGVVAAVFLSVLLQGVGMYAGWLTLTAPFVLATWTVLLVKRWKAE